MNSLFSVWKKRNKISHKGQNGRVLIIGGSKEYVGAVVLAGLAALRIGADIVTIAAPEKVAWAINSYSPDLITFKLKGDYIRKQHLRDVLSFAQQSDVVLLGNGLGRNSDDFVRTFVKKVNKPCVIDASALKARPHPTNAVLTPHHKEFELFSGKKLTGNLKKDIKIVQEVAQKNVILLKGPVDIIATKSIYHLNRSGNPGMTKGGTGDVLAGFCAGLMAQKLGHFEAACLAASLNGKLGDNLKKKMGYSFLASDIVKNIF